MTELRLPYQDLVVPDSWPDVETFAKWYINAGLPLIFPSNVEVYCSDDATSVCLFRHGRFQVELYLVHPEPFIPKHGHPGVESIEMIFDNVNRLAKLEPVLQPHEQHGPEIRLKAMTRGFPLITFQRWLDRDPVTIASMWNGNTVGPKHKKLIDKVHTNPLVVGTYVDTSRTNFTTDNPRSYFDYVLPVTKL